jgi:hypothetical protein
MAESSDKIKKLLLFQTNRCIINFYKNHLSMLESVQKEHVSMLKKVGKETSKEFSENIDYFDDEKYNYLRKKTLDLGNDILRELENNLEMFEIRIK